MSSPFLVALAWAALVAYVAYQAAPIPAYVWRKRTAELLSEEEKEELPFSRGMVRTLGALTYRFAPARWLLNTSSDLRWAGLLGRWRGWTGADVWGLRVTGLFGGLILGFLMGSPPVALILAAILFFLPGSLLASKAEEAKKAVTRELPEMASLLALLLGTGLGMDEALRRLSEGRGVFCLWLREVLASASGRPLFSVPGEGVEGVLLARAKESGLPELVAFASQVDLASGKGAGAADMMEGAAAGMAVMYNARLRNAAESVDTKLAPVVFIFFFVPFLAFMLAPALGRAVGFLR